VIKSLSILILSGLRPCLKNASGHVFRNYRKRNCTFLKCERSTAGLDFVFGVSDADCVCVGASCSWIGGAGVGAGGGGADATFFAASRSCIFFCCALAAAATLSLDNLICAACADSDLNLSVAISISPMQSNALHNANARLLL
jgi:hypothetical protein